MNTNKEKEQKDRIMRLAQQAKCAAELAGDGVPSDETLLRAASAIDVMDRQRDRFDQYDDDDDDMVKMVCVLIVAASFTGDHPLVDLLAKKGIGGGE